MLSPVPLENAVPTQQKKEGGKGKKGGIVRRKVIFVREEDRVSYFEASRSCEKEKEKGDHQRVWGSAPDNAQPQGRERRKKRGEKRMRVCIAKVIDWGRQPSSSNTRHREKKRRGEKSPSGVSSLVQCPMSKEKKKRREENHRQSAVHFNFLGGIYTSPPIFSRTRKTKERGKKTQKVRFLPVHHPHCETSFLLDDQSDRVEREGGGLPPFLYPKKEKCVTKGIVPTRNGKEQKKGGKGKRGREEGGEKTDFAHIQGYFV